MENKQTKRNGSSLVALAACPTIGLSVPRGALLCSRGTGRIPDGPPCRLDYGRERDRGCEDRVLDRPACSAFEPSQPYSLRQLDRTELAQTEVTNARVLHAAFLLTRGVWSLDRLQLHVYSAAIRA